MKKKYSQVQGSLPRPGRIALNETKVSSFTKPQKRTSSSINMLISHLNHSFYLLLFWQFSHGYCTNILTNKGQAIQFKLRQEAWANWMAVRCYTKNRHWLGQQRRRGASKIIQIHCFAHLLACLPLQFASSVLTCLPLTSAMHILWWSMHKVWFVWAHMVRPRKFIASPLLGDRRNTQEKKRSLEMSSFGWLGAFWGCCWI